MQRKVRGAAVKVVSVGQCGTSCILTKSLTEAAGELALQMLFDLHRQALFEEVVPRCELTCLRKLEALPARDDVEMLDRAIGQRRSSDMGHDEITSFGAAIHGHAFQNNAHRRGNRCFGAGVAGYFAAAAATGMLMGGCRGLLSVERLRETVNYPTKTPETVLRQSQH